MKNNNRQLCYDGSQSFAMKMSVNPHVRVQAKVGHTDMSTLQESYSSLWVGFSILVGLAPPAQVLQAFFLKGFDTLVNIYLPATVLRGKGLPALKLNASCSEQCFQAILVALEWLPNVSCTSSQLREENHLWESRVIHLYKVPYPSKLRFHDECLDARDVSSAKHFSVGDAVPPGCLMIFQSQQR